MRIFGLDAIAILLSPSLAVAKCGWFLSSSFSEVLRVCKCGAVGDSSVVVPVIDCRAYESNSLSFSNCNFVLISSNGFRAVLTSTVQTAPLKANRPYSFGFNSIALF